MKKRRKRKRLNGFQKQAKEAWKAYLSRGKKPLKAKQERSYNTKGMGNN